MHCWNCGEELDLVEGKISFRCECEGCGAWQHACRNCKFYKQGAPSDCAVPGIEPVTDKEKMNFCDEFKAIGKKRLKADPKEAARRLFGDEDSDSPPNSGPDPFSRLFGD